MLKKRLIACLNTKNQIVVQSILFQRYLPIGKPEIAVDFLNQWGIDEIIVLDLDATNEKRTFEIPLIHQLSKKCFTPLTIGGGINSLEDIKNIIRNGADKVSLNTAAVKNQQLIKVASETFGNQCIVVSIDAKKNNNGTYEVYLNSGKEPTSLSPVELAKKVELLGAGEILINSIERDGSKKGYDLELVKLVSEAVSIPVIACGGVGHPQHFNDLFTHTKVMAAAAGNYFHFTEHSPITTKSFILNGNESKNEKPFIRISTNCDYRKFLYDQNGRIDRQSDDYLKKIMFEYKPPEVI